MTESELDPVAIAANLTTQWIGQLCYTYGTLASTNDRLKEMLAAEQADGLPAGTVVLTEFQSAGRGRLGRRWEAPPGSSLLFSVLFRPSWPVEQATWLTMLGSVAVAEAIESTTGLQVGLKWPNDLMLSVDGVWRKVCGLLLDTQFDHEGRLETAVLGIGLNVNIQPGLLPETATLPTSLLAVMGQQVDRLELLISCLENLEKHYERATQGNSPWLEWNRRLLTLGQAVKVTHLGRQSTVSGIAEATGPEGQLLIRDENGRLRTIVAGDVTLRV